MAASGQPGDFQVTKVIRQVIRRKARQAGRSEAGGPKDRQTRSVGPTVAVGTIGAL